MIGNNFYQSSAWVDLMKRLKLERLDDRGELRCEHCGGAITRSYDCIGHHIIELNDRNVNDVNIALNPENIMLVHHRCHNKIHHKLSMTDRRNVYLVYGAPFSGKSTFVRENMEQGDLIVDIDNIWQCVSGCDKLIKPPCLKANVFNVRDMLVEQIKYRLGKWVNAWVVGGYPLVSERERLVRAIGAREIFIDTTKDECLQRLYDAALTDGRNVEEWRGFIADWFDKYTPPIQ